MDLTIEYIKMCEKATEIQKHFKVSERTVIYRSQRNKHFLLFVWKGSGIFAGDDFLSIDDSGKITWLPRQDQLQELLGYHYNFSFFYNIVSWMQSFKLGEFSQYSDCSVEQLILIFVMKEKYNKIWNSAEGHEEWVEDFREEKK